MPITHYFRIFLIRSVGEHEVLKSSAYASRCFSEVIRHRFFDFLK
jgi:hypothetical protein